ncbi:MAG: hypothetical protein HYV09_35800 [Deltaproteobacteria bacterium]|nr:hypothetical protein [Deltaproteobacteria bacterium]
MRRDATPLRSTVRVGAGGWEAAYGLPVVWFGGSAAGYSDRLRACAMRRRRAA